MNNKFYVTTPIYYVTAKPHLGSLYSTVLADIAARWHRLQGRDVFFLTGTDEHGQKVATAAQAAGKDPQTFVDSFIPAYQDAWKNYDISYTKFIRTTDPEHVKAVQHWLSAMYEKGDIYQGAYEGYYCIPCETFVLEKDAPPTKIRDCALDTTGTPETPLCTACTRATSWVAEPAYFFKLSKYQDKLLKFYEDNPGFVTPHERLAEVVSFVKEGLKDLAISRSRKAVSWGIPLPWDAEHVCYVWADALNNYITAVGYPNNLTELQKWWPADQQVMGKDIVRFHAIYWPAFLMATELAMPKQLLVHGWITVDKQKMSKSLGNVVDPLVLRETYGSDAVRYYMARHMAITHDAPFSTEDLEQRINSDLVHDLSNLLHRMTSLAKSANVMLITYNPQQVDPTFAAKMSERRVELVRIMEHEMSFGRYHRAYTELWAFIHEINKYFHAQEPWKLLKADRAAGEQVLFETARALEMIGTLIAPVMPQTSAKLLAALGIELSFGVGKEFDHLTRLTTDALVQQRQNYTLQPGAPLFMTIEKKQPTECKEVAQEVAQPAAAPTNVIGIEDFMKVELVVGTITKVDTLEKSNKLYVLTVSAGVYGTRTICSGVRMHFAPEELLGKQGVFVANLAPRPMLGVISQGMMLFAEDAAGKLQLTTVGATVPDGTKLR